MVVPLDRNKYLIDILMQLKKKRIIKSHKYFAAFKSFNLEQFHQICKKQKKKDRGIINTILLKLQKLIGLTGLNGRILNVIVI